MKALLIGGTGPTGPHVIEGLLARGLEVTIFHRGVHEPPRLGDIEHIHGDPHFSVTIEEALGTREFDVVLAMYGRVKFLAAALAGRCERFLSVGGVPVYDGYFPRPGTLPLPIPITEAHPVVRVTGNDPALRFSRLIAEAEEATFEYHPRATVFRYSMIYGPDNPKPHEWSVVRRVRDHRPHMVLPDGGCQIHTRCAARNAAAFLLAALDSPDAAAGQIYNCGDPYTWSFRQWAEAIIKLLGAEMEILSIPTEIAVDAAAALLPAGNTAAMHCILSTEKAERELGYRPVIDPIDALQEILDWYASGHDPGSYHRADRFDYTTEDALVTAYGAAVDRIAATVEQHPEPPAHGMPHPKEPGLVDHRGR